jgi:hypothetical protein
VESTTGSRLADLETLVSNLPTQQTSDPRDTIYALLSISSDAQPHTFEVDYNKNSTQVFKDFIQFCVNRSKSIDVICRYWALEPVKTPRNVSHAPYWSRSCRTKDDLLPSWVPRVSGLPFEARGRNRYGRNNGDSIVGAPKRRFCNASKGTTSMAMFGEIETPTDDDQIPVAMTSAFGTQNIQAGKINHAPLSSSFSFHQTPS